MRCTDFPAMLAAVARRTTRCVRCALSAQTSATSQTTKRAARAATATALLGASHGALRPAHARLGNKGVGAPPVDSHFISCCGRRCPVGAISGAAVTASLGPGAPVRASFLTRGHCLSGESAANAASLAAPAPGWWAQRSRRFSADRPSMSPRRAAPAAAREVLRTRTAARPALHPKKAKGKTLKSLTPSPTHPMAPGWKSTRTRRPPSAGEVSSCSVAPCRSATALTMASPRPLPAEAASGTR